MVLIDLNLEYTPLLYVLFESVPPSWIKGRSVSVPQIFTTFIQSRSSGTRAYILSAHKHTQLGMLLWTYDRHSEMFSGVARCSPPCMLRKFAEVYCN